MDRHWVNKGGLDLSKEVLWVSVDQRAADVQAVNVGGLKKSLPTGPGPTWSSRPGFYTWPAPMILKVWGQQKILPNSPARAKRVRTGPLGRIFCWPPTLTACSSSALWPTETHSTFLERSKPPLLTQSLSKSLAALLMYFISIQSDLISIGLM